MIRKKSILNHGLRILQTRRKNDATLRYNCSTQSTTKDTELPVSRESPYQVFNRGVCRTFDRVREWSRLQKWPLRTFIKGERAGSSSNANGKKRRISANRRRRINYFENKHEVRSNVLLLACQQINYQLIAYTTKLEVNLEKIEWKSRARADVQKMSNPSKQKFQETHNLWCSDPAKGRALTTPWAIVPFHFRAPRALTPPSNVRGDNASPCQESAQSYRAGYKTILLCYNERENILRLLLN